MNTFKIDGRKTSQSFTTNDGYTVHVVKTGGLYCICVWYKSEQSAADYPLLDGTKEDAQNMVNDLLNVDKPAIDTTKPVAIYKNLHNGKFSVKQGGRVVAHVDSILLTNVSLRVSEAGRQRVLRDKQKNVHAYVVGMVKEINGMAPLLGARLSYNPYKAGYFVYCHNDNKARLHSSQLLYCDAKKGLFIAK